MTKSSILLIIEAPGKRQALLQAARKVYPGTDVHVLATGGLIWELPMDTLGVDLGTLHTQETRMLPGGKLFQEALDKELEARGDGWPQMIGVLTDPDREGEGIADQVWRMLELRNLDAIAKRGWVDELSVEGLQQARWESNPDEGMVASRQARRAIDRLIPKAMGKMLSTASWKGLGRVQMVACRLIDQKMKEWKRWRLRGNPFPEDRKWVVNHASMTSDTAGFAWDAVRKVRQDQVEVREYSVVPPPVHNSYSLWSAFPQMEPRRVFEAAQEAYMAGRIGYPRTEGEFLRNRHRHGVVAMTRMHHLGGFVRDGWWNDEEDESGKSAHPGIAPLMAILDPPPQGYSMEAMEVEREVMARAMACTMVPARVRESRILIPFHHGEPIEIRKTEILEPGWTAAHERLGMTNPMLLEESLAPRQLRIENRSPTETDQVQWMVEAGIGKPSTLAFVPQKMKENGWINTWGHLNEKARFFLETVDKRQIPVADLEFGANFEMHLDRIRNQPGRYFEEVQGILMDAGIDPLLVPLLEKPLPGWDAKNYRGVPDAATA